MTLTGYVYGYANIFIVGILNGPIILALKTINTVVLYAVEKEKKECIVRLDIIAEKVKIKCCWNCRTYKFNKSRKEYECIVNRKLVASVYHREIFPKEIDKEKLTCRTFKSK